MIGTSRAEDEKGMAAGVGSGRASQLYPRQRLSSASQHCPRIKVTHRLHYSSFARFFFVFNLVSVFFFFLMSDGVTKEKRQCCVWRFRKGGSRVQPSNSVVFIASVFHLEHVQPQIARGNPAQIRTQKKIIKQQFQDVKREGSRNPSLFFFFFCSLLSFSVCFLSANS